MGKDRLFPNHVRLTGLFSISLTFYTGTLLLVFDPEASDAAFLFLWCQSHCVLVIVLFPL